MKLFELFCILLLTFPFDTKANQEKLQNSTLESKSDLAVPRFREVVTTTRSIYLSWEIPYFSLRTVLLYKQNKQDLTSIHIANGVRNHMLESLEPGVSYMVILQIYYNSADLETITNIITTLPIKPEEFFRPVESAGFEVEIQLLVKTLHLSTSDIAEKTTNKVKLLTHNFSDVKNIYIYSIREELPGIYIIMYLDVAQASTAQALFNVILESQSALDSDPLGFTYKILRNCCKPIYFYSFNNEADYLKDDIMHLQIVQNAAFQFGRCGSSFDMSKGDITVETRGQQPLTALTISLYVKLKNVMGLHPIVSAVNFHSQLRLEVQEGRLVWLFYNIGNRQGFIISSSNVIKKDVWVHVLVDYNTLSGLGRIFINGNLQKKMLSHAVLSTHWILGLRIGKYFSGGFDYKMDGYLDEFQIFGCTMTLKQISILSESCGKVNECLPKQNNETRMSSLVHNMQREWNHSIFELSGVSGCNSAGVSPEEPNSFVNECKCKKNVEGPYCDKCKDGFFNLQLQNKDGCTKCFCNGLTQSCRSAKLERKQNVLNANDINNLNLRTLEGDRANKDNILYNPITNSVSYKAESPSDGSILYWELPLSYCGDKVASYGGNLRFTISYLSKPYEKPLYGPDVVLMSNNTQLTYTEGKEPLPGNQYHFQVILDEKFWIKDENEQVSREEFIIALTNIQSFLLRATYSTEMIESNLYEVRLDVAEYDPLISNHHVAPMVEECLCPSEYFGTSCQHCNKGFTKVKDLLLRRCAPCQCNNHAEDCDGSTGICRNCLHFTTGNHCEKCLPGYYGDPRSGRPDACLPCPCPLTIESNQFSSTCLLDTDGQPTCDACRIGYTGRNCEKCIHSYTGNPSKPGGSCVLANAVDCDIRGVEYCDAVNRKCFCKKNVKGEKCNQCKSGSFYLHKGNKDGCLSCWCFGVTKICQSSDFFDFNLQLHNVSGIKMTNFEETLNISAGFYMGSENEVIFSDLLESSVLYWSLPSIFCQEKLSAYGGVLSYSISYEEKSSGNVYIKPDVKIKGNGKAIVYQGNITVLNKKVSHMVIPMHEEKWFTLSGQSVSREEFLFILSNIESFLIRGTYSSRTKSTSLSNVLLSRPLSVKSSESMKSVEICKCPTGYVGTSCERCAIGYFRFRTATGELRCQKCQCNGFSASCDSVTGVCSECQNNTRGAKCEECILGFFGDPSNGVECKQCLCPLRMSTNQFSSSCKLYPDGGYVCDACKTGYSGRYCGECAIGYTGNPQTPGGTCKKSAMRYTSEPSVKITPESRKDRLGTIATFHCSASGEQPLTIQWSRTDGRPFASNVKFTSTSTSKTLTIMNIDKLDEQTYICSAKNDYGLSSGMAVLNVVVHRLLPIRVSVTPKSLHIEQGGTARFICNHDSDLTSTITWRRENFEKLPSDAQVKNGIITIPNVNQGHSGLYSCKVSNQYSNDQVSVQLRVGVPIPPKAAIYPIEIVADINENVKFRCSASGYPTPTISWEREAGKSMSENVKIDEDHLEVKKVQLDDEGQYFCTAANQGGTVSSRSVLYVRGPNSLPIVNITPNEIRVQLGTAVMFLCNVSGTVLKLNWKRTNGDLPISSVVRDRELHILSTDFADQGQYECVASNQYGEVVAKSNLFVEPDPGFKPKTYIKPKFVSVTEGNFTQIQCNVTGSPLPIVLWSKPNGLLTNNHIIEGNHLKILKVSADDSGTYVCSGQNKFGIDSSTSVLSVERRLLPEIVITSPINIVTYVGESISFFCQILNGIPKPILIWKTLSGYQVPASQLKKVDEGLVLKLSEISKSHEGQYICVASNIAGIQEKRVNLTVKGDPRVLFKPHGEYRVRVGDQASIKCFGYGYPAPYTLLTLPNHISKDKYNITHKGAFIEFSFIVDFSLAGNYTCTGKNSHGEKYDVLSLIVQKEDEFPVISKLPQNVTIDYLSTFKMVCKAQGTPNPKIYWTKGKEQNKVSNKPLLQIHSVVVTDEDDYQCHALNRKGAAVSFTKLIVRVSPNVEIFPPIVIVKQGHAFTIKCLVKSKQLFTIKWEKQGLKDMSQFSTIISGDELVVPSATKDYAGTYICIYKDANSELNSTVNVTVVEPPIIVAASETVFRVNLNATVALKCNVTGYPSPVINWVSPKGSNGVSVVYGEFILTNVSKYDQGQYKCRASNAGGFAEETFTVLINELPRIVILGGTHVSVSYGSHVAISCKAYGVPLPTIQWSKRKENINKNIKTAGGILHFSNVTSEHSGTYRCVAKNDIGSVLSEVQIHVRGSPTVSIFPTALSVGIKELVKFVCNVTGHPKPKISWLKIDGALPEQIYLSEDFLVIPSVKVSDAGVYICKAENLQGTAEATVTLKVLDFVPRFIQEDSMQVFGNIPNALSQTKISMWFKPEKPDGLLIYRGSQVKDFLSILIRDFYVIFCFNLGSGSAIIKTTKRFQLHTWISIEARQDQSIGSLKMNDDNPVYGKSLGKFNELNLDSELYLGGYEDVTKIFVDVGIVTSFFGCVSELILNNRRIEFVDALTSRNVEACNTCIGNPCKNGGTCNPSATKFAFVCTCIKNYTGVYCEDQVERCYPDACFHEGQCVNHERNGYSCKCPLGVSGKRCDYGHSILIPAFNSSSFLSYPIPNLRSKALAITVTFKAQSIKDFELLSIEQTFQNKNKFLNVGAEKGSLVLKYNLGDGTVILNSKVIVVLDQWFDVHFEIKGKYSSLSVNGLQALKNSSNGAEDSLNLNTNSLVYIGKGISNHGEGFIGCISQLIINSKKIDLSKDYITAKNISSCYKQTSPCLSQPCLHGGTCIAISEDKFICKCASSYIGVVCESEISICGNNSKCKNNGVCKKMAQGAICLCPFGFSGVSCQQTEKLGSSIMLSEYSYILFPKSNARYVEENKISFFLKTVHEEGMVLWQGQDPATSPDSLLIGIRNGALEIQFELRNEKEIGLSNFKINDGRWHYIDIHRQSRTLTCMIDEKVSITLSSGGFNTGLNVYAFMYLGGGIKTRSLSQGKYLRSYEGCIQNFTVEGKVVNFSQFPIEAWNVLPCK